jgi:putative protease
LAKEFLLLASEVIDPAEYRRKAMGAHKKRFGAACHQNVCYYPEFFQEGEV